MGSISKAVAALSQEEINRLDSEAQLPMQVEGQDIVLLKEEVEIFSQDIPGWCVVNEGSLTIAIDLEITEELK